MATGSDGRRAQPQKIISKASELETPDRDDGAFAPAPPIPSDHDEWTGAPGDGEGEDSFLKALLGPLTVAEIAQANALYSGPFYGPSDPDHRGPSVSPYIIALKRALVRWTRGTGALKWQPGGNYNATYNAALEHDVALFKDHKGIDTQKWVWGQGAHNALEFAIRGGGAPAPVVPNEPALDRVALALMENAYDLKHPGDRNLAKARSVLASYLEEMEYYDSIWHYLQQRPIGSMGVTPSHGGRDDCSALGIAAYWWTRLHSGLVIPDPAGYNYTGYGNTVSTYTTNRGRQLGLSATFEVGDVALYGPFASRHETICRKRGAIDSAIFTSHGSESGPNPTYIRYRDDLFTIVRPVLVQTMGLSLSA